MSDPKIFRFVVDPYSSELCFKQEKDLSTRPSLIHNLQRAKVQEHHNITLLLVDEEF
jgi:hypothetical protein